MQPAASDEPSCLREVRPSHDGNLITTVQVAKYFYEVLHGCAAFHVHPFGRVVSKFCDDCPVSSRGALLQTQRFLVIHRNGTLGVAEAVHGVTDPWRCQINCEMLKLVSLRAFGERESRIKTTSERPVLHRRVTVHR